MMPSLPKATVTPPSSMPANCIFSSIRFTEPFSAANLSIPARYSGGGAAAGAETFAAGALFFGASGFFSGTGAALAAGAATTPLPMRFSMRSRRSRRSLSASCSGWQARTAASSRIVRGWVAHFISLSTRMNSSMARISCSRLARPACSRKRCASSGVISRMRSSCSPATSASSTPRRWLAASSENTRGSLPRRMASSIMLSAAAAS